MDAAEDAPRTRRGRVTRSRDFDAVYRKGRSAAGRHLVVYAFTREDVHEPGPRLGLSVSKKVGGAVERNRIKRVLREQFARHNSGVPQDADLVVIARPGVVDYLDTQGSDALGSRLHELLSRLFAHKESA